MKSRFKKFQWTIIETFFCLFQVTMFIENLLQWSTASKPTSSKGILPLKLVHNHFTISELYNLTHASCRFVVPNMVNQRNLFQSYFIKTLEPPNCFH